METLEQQVNKIKKDIADLNCVFIFGKTCEELVQEIFAGVVERHTQRT